MLNCCLRWKETGTSKEVIGVEIFHVAEGAVRRKEMTDKMGMIEPNLVYS